MKYAKPIIENIDRLTENFGYKTDFLGRQFG